MPYLQLDTPFAVTADQKRQLARRFGEIYSRHMETDAARVTVAIRELGRDNMWRCGPGEPYPAALLMCDIRKGRDSDKRAELARLLSEAATKSSGCRRTTSTSNSPSMTATRCIIQCSAE